MLKHSGGDRVGKGTYWNFTTGARIDISEEETLPGNRKNSFYRMPAAAVIVAAPALGFLYAAFLPFIGIAMMVKLVGQKLGGGVMDVVAGSASFGFRPSESYLAGRRKSERTAGSAGRENKDNKAKDSAE